ncbi:MAG: hypothetical protein Q9184_005766 [Pyrenodesmia sp. 2 TL-2023]
MDTPQEILRDFNPEELALPSTQGRWDYFRTLLDDVEMVVAAREFVPEGHSVKAGLQGHICRFLGMTHAACQQRHGHNSSKMLCADQMRLVNLFAALKGLPQARARIKEIIDDEIRNDTDKQDSIRVIPGCKDSQAHRSLLDIYNALGSGNNENKAVESAVIKAILSHNRQAQQASGTSGSCGETSTFIPDQDNVQNQETCSLQVKEIRLGVKTFEDISIQLIHYPERDVLELRVQEALSVEDDTKLDLDTMEYYTVRHSPSKKQIALALDRSSSVEPSIFDMRMNTTEEGEKLIEKLNVLGLLFNVDDIRPEEASPKRKREPAKKEPAPMKVHKRSR